LLVESVTVVAEPMLFRSRPSKRDGHVPVFWPLASSYVSWLQPWHAVREAFPISITIDKLNSRAHTLIMNEKEKLQAYSEKRDFRRTPEPGGDTRPRHKEPVFVIQKHDARNLHYDLRLEANGVLKSWAVPKGPSTDPAVKRLAVATEDHPLEYAEFEGSIPEGGYGAGEVIVWDTGTYRNTTKKNGKSIPVEDAIDHGYLTVWLEGKKLRGGYALNRFRRDKREQWLLVKLKDEAADPQGDPVSMQPESVLSSRTIEEVRAGEKREKMSSPLK
jgi:DNA ligase D-like protein (predicted 3'-phosphoesterase)